MVWFGIGAMKLGEMPELVHPHKCNVGRDKPSLYWGRYVR